MEETTTSIFTYEYDREYLYEDDDSGQLGEQVVVFEDPERS
jgi:hypothetical protein